MNLICFINPILIFYKYFAEFSDDFFNENSHSAVEIINQDELYFYNNFHYLGIKINLEMGGKHIGKTLEMREQLRQLFGKKVMD